MYLYIKYKKNNFGKRKIFINKTQKMELSTVAIISLLGFPLLQLFQNQTLSTRMADSCSEQLGMAEPASSYREIGIQYILARVPIIASRFSWDAYAQSIRTVFLYSFGTMKCNNMGHISKRCRKPKGKEAQRIELIEREMILMTRLEL